MTILLLSLVTSCGEPEKEVTNLVDDSQSAQDSNSEDLNQGVNEEVEEQIVYAIVDNLGTGDYSNLESAVAAGETNIFVKNGTYLLTDTIFITTEGTTILGESAENVKIIQSSTGKDLLVVRADNVTVDNVTLDTETYNAQAAFVEGGANYTTLKNSIIKGGSNIFTIFYAGPNVTEGAATIAAYQAANLSDSNKLINNTISSNFSGDAISFSLQINGEVSGNTIEKGMLAFYMVRDSVCKNNTINNALQSGIFVSLPVYNSIVEDNIINDPFYYGVTVKPQGEHDYSGEYIHSEQVIIQNNIITHPRVHGISIDGNGGDATRGNFQNSTITGNNITIDDYAGIYVIRSNDLTISNNTITFDGADRSRRGVDGAPAISSHSSNGIYFEVGVTNSTISGNTIIKSKAANDVSVDDSTNVAQNAITIEAAGQTGNSVINNIFDNYYGLYGQCKPYSTWGDPGGSWVHSHGTGIRIINDNTVTTSGNINTEDKL